MKLPLRKYCIASVLRLDELNAKQAIASACITTKIGKLSPPAKEIAA